MIEEEGEEEEGELVGTELETDFDCLNACCTNLVGRGISTKSRERVQRSSSCVRK